jgi:putative transposase
VSRWRLYYHVVWGTHLREPMIDSALATLIEQSIHTTCRREKAFIHALGFMPDHVHLAVSIPPNIAIAALMKLIKGRSSREVNLNVGLLGYQLKWQPDYSVDTFGERSLERVVAYINNQPDRHQNSTLWTDWELPDLRPRDR